MSEAGPEPEQGAAEKATPAERVTFSRRLARFLNQQELSPEERRSVLEDLFVFGKQNQVPFLIRMSVLLVLSTVIATAGLISDSAAVVIGAMLVAPLMTPVLAAAGAVVMGWPSRFYQALWMIAAMAAGALLLSSLLTLVSPELVILPEQVLARTRPTFWDLIIALAAGSAGAYTITRKESSAIPGVAVAVALLPPLASTGILVTSGEHELALRALVLFLTNFIAMVLAGAITFLAVGVSPAASRRRSAGFIRSQFYLFALMTGAICIPLWFYSEKVIFNANYQAARSEVLQEWLRRHRLELVDVEISREERFLSLSLAGPDVPTPYIGHLHEALIERHQLEDDGFRIDYTWTRKVTGTWPTESLTVSEAAAETLRASSELLQGDWSWMRTDYAEGEATTPDIDDPFVLEVEPRGKLEVRGDCGRLRGRIDYAQQTLSITFPAELNVFRRACLGDAGLQQFVEDLEAARQITFEGETIRLMLRGDTGVMTLRRR
ncbi:MAG: TIGR00341 family protein [Pseudomonadota bacterium]